MDPPPRKKKAGEGQDGAAVAIPLQEGSDGLVPRPVTGKEEPPVSIKQLIEARRGEIVLFEETVRKTSGGTGGGAGRHRRAHQLLPRHLRRRAMSYNPYLVPLRLRAMAIKQSENTAAPEGRSKLVPKSIDKNGASSASGSTPTGKLSLYAKPVKFWRRRRPVRRMGGNEQSGLWLETHLWHAKRAKMVNYAGYKIAIQMSNCARRPAWRAAHTNALCLDSSFVRALSISGPLDAITTLFAKLGLNASFHVLDFNLRKLHGVFLNKPSHTSPSKTLSVPMAPARIHGRKVSGTQYQFLLWLDPNAISEVESVIKEIGGKNITIQRFGALQNRFEIIGPKSGDVLQKILDPLNAEAKKSLAKHLSARPKTIPAGTTLVLEVRDPRLIRFAHRLEAKPSPKASSSSFPSLVSMMDNLILHGSAQKDAATSSKAIDTCPLFNATDASEFACKYHDHETQDPKTMAIVSEASKTWILLQRFEEGGDEHEGWYLTVPPTWGKVFWRSLIRPGGARPIGLRERQDLDFEAGRPRFPQDFPGCLSYERYLLTTSENLRAAWMRRPTQKRLNHAKLGFAEPFKPDFLALWQRCTGRYANFESNGLAPIVDLCYSFGSCENLEKNGSKVRPTYAKASTGQYTLRLPLVPVLITLEEGGTTLKYNAHVYELDAKKTGSESIGFVTSGSFSYTRGKCTAIAYIAASHLPTSPNSILVRNVSSTEFHIATWELIAPIYG